MSTMRGGELGESSTIVRAGRGVDQASSRASSYIRASLVRMYIQILTEYLRHHDHTTF
jgi:hypothetical protein